MTDSTADALLAQSQSNAEVILDDNAIVQKQVAEMRNAKWVCILLQPGDHIPPTGQFFGINGLGFMLVPSVECWVPEFLLETLETAVEDRAVIDEKGNITGYAPTRRFPFELVRNPKSKNPRK